MGKTGHRKKVKRPVPNESGKYNGGNRNERTPNKGGCPHELCCGGLIYQLRAGGVRTVVCGGALGEGPIGGFR